MADKFTDKLIKSIQGAALFESGTLVRPEVIIWCDPENQWKSIISTLQEQLPFLLIFGDYSVEKKTGPAIWLKCMVAKVLSEAKWTDRETPIIYLPGISKQDLKNLSNARPELMPLMEYQYTGVFWQHRNGKEWTVNAFLQNGEEGLGLNVSQDAATREAALKALDRMVMESDIAYPSFVNADFLYGLLLPNETQSIFKWLDRKDEYLISLGSSEQSVFIDICQSRYNFYPDPRNINDIVEQLASRKNNWQKVWDAFIASPQKYPWIEELLRQCIPGELGVGLFAFPEDSFPQINEEQEEILRKSFLSTQDKSFLQASKEIIELEQKHGHRRTWVWAEMGKAPLANSLLHLSALSAITSMPIPSGTFKELNTYYLNTAHKADYAALKALSFGTSITNKTALVAVIGRLYKEWLENLTNKFQSLIPNEISAFETIPLDLEKDEFILFVDAFRYDLACAFVDAVIKNKHKATVSYSWSAIPSVTPTSKPSNSPIVPNVNTNSICNDFRPQALSGKDLTHANFKNELQSLGFKFISDFEDIEIGKQHWMEIGSIDSTGHTEQSGIVKRIDELFDLINETVDTIFEKGIRKIKIVTDHGWLMLPGGLPKTELPGYHTETRWGRCALIKEGRKSELLHLPWRWNKNVLIAYAPGITFFKKNEEYAHGGISMQECCIPVITIENGKQPLRKVSVAAKWTHLKCTLEITGADSACKVMIRTKHNDGASVISTVKNVSSEGKVTLFVEEAECEGLAAFVVITETDGTVIFKQQTIIGE